MIENIIRILVLIAIFAGAFIVFAIYSSKNKNQKTERELHDEWWDKPVKEEKTDKEDKEE